MLQFGLTSCSFYLFHISISPLLIQQEHQFTPPAKEDKCFDHVSKPYSKSKPLESSNKYNCTGRGRDIKIYTYCQKPDHTIEVCFKKHGLPPYLKKENSTQATTIEDFGQDIISQQHEASHEESTIGFTVEQKQALLALLHNSTSINSPIVHHLNTSGTINLIPSSTSIHPQWILDIVVTDHVCHSTDIFTHLIYSNPILVKLPNGNTIQTN